MQNKNILIGSVVILLSLSIGAFAGMTIADRSLSSNGSLTGENTYASGWKAAMNTLKDSGVSPMPAGMEVKNLSATVTSVSGNTLSIKVSTPGLIDTPDLATRTVTLGSGTKILRLIPRDPTQLQREMDDFAAKMTQPGEVSVEDAQAIPMPYDTQEISVSDLKPGQALLIQAQEDIRDRQAFVATEIRVQPSAVEAAQVPEGENASAVSAPSN